MRKEPLATGEYYHIYNRGVDKRDIFSTARDLARFKESVKEFNRLDGIGSLRDRNPEPKGLEIEPIVAIVALTLNPNHFHFILKQLVDGGIAKYMQKLLGGYTKYFNEKNDRSGSLFQGTFKSKLIDDENYFRKIFPYTNSNYKVHDIPNSKKHLIFSSDKEYDTEDFNFVSKEEGLRILEIFENKNDFNRHCDEIISMIREERGIRSLDKTDDLP